MFEKLPIRLATRECEVIFSEEGEKHVHVSAECH